jgi:hypothetical protein
MARENEQGPGSGQPRRENGRPDIAAMMAMHDLHLLAADELRGADDELKLVCAGAGIEKRRAKLFDDRRKGAFGWTSNENVLAEPMQLRGQFDTLVVGASAGQEGIQMHNTHWLGGEFHAGCAPARY